MQIKKRFYAAFLVVLLTASSLLIFICLNFLSNNQNNPVVPIPKDNQWVLRMDAESFIKTEIYTTLFTEKDDAFVQQVKDLIERGTNENTDKKPLFIDFQEDIVLYNIKRNEKNFLVIAVQTLNSSAFNKHIADYCKSTQIGRAKGHCGIYVSQIRGLKSNKKELESILTEVLNAPFKELQKAAPEKNEFIALHWKNLPKKSGFSSMDLSIQHQDREINLEGELVYPKQLHPALKFGLNPKGVYVYSRLISEALPDTLLSFLPKGLPHFKDLQAYAVDFGGTYLEDTKDSLPKVFGFLPVPVMNLIIQTKHDCRVEELWKAFPASVRRDNLRLNFGNTSYYLKQLAPDTYFIGVDPTSIVSYNGNEVFLIKGHLEKATKVYGSTFVTAVIENMGPVKAFNDFLKSTQSVRIEIKPEKGSQYSIEGKILFKEKKHPLHELSKMVFGSGVFEL